MGIEVVEACAPPACGAWGLGDCSCAEAAVECAWGRDEVVREKGTVIGFGEGEVVGALEVGFECVEVVGDVFAGALAWFLVLG